MLGKRHLTHSSGAQFYSIPAWTLGRSCLKPPNSSYQSLAPGEAWAPRCVLLAAEGAHLPCASIMAVLSQKHPLLVWLDPQAYLLGETVRFKEHTIPIRIFFFNGLCLVVRWSQSDCPQFGVWAALAHTAAQQCQHISSAQKWNSLASSWHYRMRTEIQFKHFENLPVLSIMRVKLLLKVSLFHAIFF